MTSYNLSDYQPNSCKQRKLIEQVMQGYLSQIRTVIVKEICPGDWMGGGPTKGLYNISYSPSCGAVPDHVTFMVSDNENDLNTSSTMNLFSVSELKA